MAKNWKVGEAVKAVQDGNIEAISDIGRRFPNVIALSTTLEGLTKLVQYLPEFATARQIETRIKNGTPDNLGTGLTEEQEKEAGIGEVVEEVEEKPTKKKPAKPAKKAKEEIEEEEEVEEEEEEKPAKKASKKKPAKKAKAKKEVEEEEEEAEEEDDEDDDDWDI